MFKLKRGDRVTLISYDRKPMFMGKVLEESYQNKVIIAWDRDLLPKADVKGRTFHAGTGKCKDYRYNFGCTIRPYQVGDDQFCEEYQKAKKAEIDQIRERELVEKEAQIAEIKSFDTYYWTQLSDTRLSIMLYELREAVKREGNHDSAT